MRKLGVLVVGVLGGLVAAGCIAPTVAEAPPTYPAACRDARAVVSGFVYEMQYLTHAPEDFEAWWSGYMKGRIDTLSVNFEAAVAGCPALG